MSILVWHIHPEVSEPKDAVLILTTNNQVCRGYYDGRWYDDGHTVITKNSDVRAWCHESDIIHSFESMDKDACIARLRCKLEKQILEIDEAKHKLKHESLSNDIKQRLLDLKKDDIAMLEDQLASMGQKILWQKKMGFFGRIRRVFSFVFNYSDNWNGDVKSK